MEFTYHGSLDFAKKLLHIGDDDYPGTIDRYDNSKLARILAQLPDSLGVKNAAFYGRLYLPEGISEKEFKETQVHILTSEDRLELFFLEPGKRMEISPQNLEAITKSIVGYKKRLPQPEAKDKKFYGKGVSFSLLLDKTLCLNKSPFYKCDNFKAQAVDSDNPFSYWVPTSENIPALDYRFIFKPLFGRLSKITFYGGNSSNCVYQFASQVAEEFPTLNVNYCNVNEKVCDQYEIHGDELGQALVGNTRILRCVREDAWGMVGEDKIVIRKDLQGKFIEDGCVLACSGYVLK